MKKQQITNMIFYFNGNSKRDIPSPTSNFNTSLLYEKEIYIYSF